MKMTLEEAYKTLREYNKWRRGKGKKYQMAGFPFDSTTVACAIDVALLVLKGAVKTEKKLCESK